MSPAVKRTLQIGVSVVLLVAIFWFVFRQFADIRSRLKRMNVLGGCCGTDHRHIEQIAMSCIEAKAA